MRMAKLTFIDFFAGCGGFHSGLTRAGMQCVGWCEADKFAQRSYRAIHADIINDLWFSPDVMQVKGDDLSKADIWTAGFPCQDISIAGKQKGLNEGKRSSLFFEIVRLLNEAKENKPRWILFENVKNLISINRGGDFLHLLTSLDEAGYDAEWCVYNSKAYGVPQNRERVYIAAILRGQGSGKVLPIPRESTAVITQVGNLIDTASFGGNPQRGRVYSPEGISPSLNTCSGGGLEPKVAFVDATKGNPVMTNTARTLCARYNAGITNRNTERSYVVKIINNTNQGYLEAEKGDGIDLAYPKQNKRRGRVQPQSTQTLTTSANIGVLTETEPIVIRKLTPRECWRLQGFTDAEFEKAQAVNSDSQLYKQAGNAVTVTVVQAIGENLLRSESEE